VTSLPQRLRAVGATTPGRYRLWSGGIALTLVVIAVTGTAAAAGLRSGTDRIRNNSGPVLVATQQLVASLAEADAAASAAFLSGRQEDPEQRRLYEEALARANFQLEDVSSLIGDDERSHRSLKSLANQITRYAGLVEAARASNRAGVAGGEAYLVDALNLLGSAVANEAGQLTRATQERFGKDEDLRDAGVPSAVALGGLALIVLLAGQRVVTRLSRRLLNPPLVLATLALLLSVGWLAAANVRSGNDLRQARRDGFDSIALTARIQTTGFRAKADETVAVITGDPARRANAERAANDLIAQRVTPDMVERARAGAVDPSGGLLPSAAARADSPRERAAAAEMLVRWQRYADTVTEITSTTDPARRRAIAVGPSSAAFNGFNFSVESVLGDNRSQFLGGMDDAAQRLGGLTAITLLVPLGAAAAAMLGFRLRIAEYQ
jgi:CHASE3 domain sensor protein